MQIRILLSQTLTLGLFRWKYHCDKQAAKLRDSDELFNASRYVVFLVRLAGLPSGQDT
jgi:hypothetical protein